MKLRRLRLENYRRHVRTDVEWPDGVTAIVGRNGSGKSSLLEAIGFALFGVAATRTSKDLLRHDGAPLSDALRVVLECEIDGQAVRLVRELRGKNATAQASLELDGRLIVPSQSGSSEAVTQQMQHLMGLDREAFFTSVFSQQKELGRLASHAPADRKRLILGMLGIDALDDAIRSGRRRRNDAQVRVETLREGMPDQEALLDQLASLGEQHARTVEALGWARRAHAKAVAEVGRSEARLREARRRHDERRTVEAEVQRLASRVASDQETLTGTQRQLQEAEAAGREAASLGSTAEEVAALRRDVEQAQAAAAAAKRRRDAQERLSRVRSEAQAIRPEAQMPETNGLEKRLRSTVEEEAEQRHALKATDEELRRIQDRRRRIASLGQDAPCPVCDRLLHDHLPRLQHRFDEEARGAQALLATHQEAHAEAEGRLRALRAEQAAHERRVHAAQEAGRRLARLEAEEATLREELRRLPPEEPDADVAALSARLEQAVMRDQRRIRAAALAERLPALEQDAAALRRRVEAGNRGLEGAKRRLATMPASGPLVQEGEEAHRRVQETEREAERSVAALEQERAVSSQRIAAAEQALEQAEERAARLREAEETLEHWQVLIGRGDGILDRFRTHMVGRIRPALSTEASRLLARFTAGRYDEVILDDDYRIFVSDGGVHYAVDRFSGGETDLVHLALRLAVSRLLLERSGGIDVRLLILDEVFGSLDDERRELVLGALQELGGLYSQVLVVTHHDALRDALDSTLLVEERGGEACVTMHNG